MALLDVDEMVVPRTEKTKGWGEMLLEIGKG